MRGVRRWIKDPFPGLSHFFGAGLSVVALVVLVRASQGNPAWIIPFAIYGTSMILLYTASGLCHSLHCRPGVEKWLDRADYIAIFLLIAGTYTPVCLIALRGPWGWTILIAEWMMALAGISVILSGNSLSNRMRAILYASMGWLAALAVVPLIHRLSPLGIGLLAAGGVIYSLGAIVFVRNRPHLIPGWFNAHDLWHCMVLAGSACHFGMMLTMIAR